MDNVLYWMNRNQSGLYESGYLLTEKQLLKYTDFSKEDIERMQTALQQAKEKNEPVVEFEGSYDSNDTYTIEPVYADDYDHIKNLLTWNEFHPYESHACVEMNEEYPDYVPEDLRLPVCVYECTGETSLSFPGTNHKNSTVIDYMEILHLSQEQLRYPYDDLDNMKAEISRQVHIGSLTKADFMVILEDYEYDETFLNNHFNDGRYEICFHESEEKEVHIYDTVNEQEIFLPKDIKEEVQDMKQYHKARLYIEKELFLNTNNWVEENTISLEMEEEIER